MTLTQGLYDELRHAILHGQLQPGTRLPSTRTLAEERGVSRNTVLNAYEQLLAEGYLEARVGSGTCVARSLPEELLGARCAPLPAGAGGAPSVRPHPLSQRGRPLASNPGPPPSPPRAPPALQAG